MLSKRTSMGKKALKRPRASAISTVSSSSSDADVPKEYSQKGFRSQENGIDADETAATISTSKTDSTSSPSLEDWWTPDKQKANASYFQAIQEETICWWYSHRRNDLPWRRPLHHTSPTALTRSKDEEGISSSVVKMEESCEFTAQGNSGFSATPPVPYEIWVSEVMSQQTQMRTVIEYFDRWMRLFPTVEALATASEEQVRAVWAGMGYYRRAAFLLKGARYVLDLWEKSHPPDKNGKTPPAQLPPTAEGLLKVPGIGPYTAAAIASICYREPVIAVDGNVVRVLSRLRGERHFDPKVPQNIKKAFEWGSRVMLGGDTSKKKEKVKCDVKAKAQSKCQRTEQTNCKSVEVSCTGNQSIVCSDPGALNQGLMEIGATICKPNSAPLCGKCPLRSLCCAYAALTRWGEISSIEGVIPLRAEGTRKRVEHVVCVVHEWLCTPVSVEGTAAATRPLGKCKTPTHPMVKTENDKGVAKKGSSGSYFVVVRRPEEGLLGGMLEFPSITVESHVDANKEEDDDEKPTNVKRSKALKAVACGVKSSEVEKRGASLLPPSATLKAAAQRLSCSSCIDTLQLDQNEKKCLKEAVKPRYVGRVSHIFSHIDMTVHIYQCRWNKNQQFDRFTFSSTKETNKMSEMDDHPFLTPLCHSLAESLTEESVDNKKGEPGETLGSPHLKAEETLQETCMKEMRKRISVICEKELHSNACSRLMLKVYETIQRSNASPFSLF